MKTCTFVKLLVATLGSHNVARGAPEGSRDNAQHENGRKINSMTDTVLSWVP
jgi:hypothetical protein